MTGQNFPPTGRFPGRPPSGALGKSCAGWRTDHSVRSLA